MVKTYGNHTEKVTFNIPVELKKQLMVLKEEMHVSLSSIYNEAIANYIRQKELEKWQHGVEAALQDQTYLTQTKELGEDGEELYEY